MPKASSAVTAESPITALKGVGDKRAKIYEKIGVKTVGDLLLHFPREYEDRGNVRLLTEACDGARCSFLLTVGTVPRLARLPRHMTLLKFRAFDDSASAEIIYFNQDYLKNVFEQGKIYRFTGRAEWKGNTVSLSSPAYEELKDDVELPTLYPIYSLTDGLSGKMIAKDVAAALSVLAASDFTDPIPDEILARNDLCSRSFAVKTMHDPQSFRAIDVAKRRLIFEEFFLFALGLATKTKPEREGTAPKLTGGDISELTGKLPYELTNAQRTAVAEIYADMAKNTPMQRILVGDVGCGKTIVAAAAIYRAVRSGKQAALMVPTEILARQHYADLCPLFSSLGISTELLIGATTAKKKEQIKTRLRSPDPAERIDFIIGTQALLTDDVVFFDNGLTVTDEQHRFGVEQRATLAKKAGSSHRLVMSATPIPRSLALTVFGDLSLSRIGEMPPGRQRVDTFVVDESYRERLNAFIRKQVEDGGQVYVVCPAIGEDREETEGDEDLSLAVSLNEITGEGIEKRLPLKSAVEFCETLRSALPELEIACLHGKMKAKDKDAVMKKFVSGEVKVLVSTTVIEVGVNVPDATLMIIENADRFGLSQLHQLRGRVGRGKRKAYCVLVSGNDAGATAKERLNTMRTMYDGFAIAEKDLELRGPGDFLRHNETDPFRQSGSLTFRLADLCSDAGLFHLAFAESERLVGKKDPEKAAAAREAYPRLFVEVEKTFASRDDGSVS